METLRKTTTAAVWLGILSWLGSAGIAHGQDESPMTQALQVFPGATCVSQASLAPQIEAWLAGSRPPRGLSVYVQGDPEDPRDVAFEVRRGEETLAYRRFAPSPFVCAQLEATLSLAIAMALKASLREELLSDLGDEPGRWGHVDSLSLQVRAGSGLLPRRSFGGGVAFSREFGDRFSLRTELFVDGARGMMLEGARGSFDTWMLSAQIAGCALLPMHDSFRARACFGVAIGALRASGEGYAAARADWLAWVAVANSLGLSARLSGSWWLDVPVTVFIPVNDVSFRVVDDNGDAASARSLPVVGLTVGLATEYRF